MEGGGQVSELVVAHVQHGEVGEEQPGLSRRVGADGTRLKRDNFRRVSPPDQ